MSWGNLHDGTGAEYFVFETFVQRAMRIRGQLRLFNQPSMASSDWKVQVLQAKAKNLNWKVSLVRLFAWPSKTWNVGMP